MDRPRNGELPGVLCLDQCLAPNGLRTQIEADAQLVTANGFDEEGRKIDLSRSSPPETTGTVPFREPERPTESRFVGGTFRGRHVGYPLDGAQIRALENRSRER